MTRLFKLCLLLGLMVLLPLRSAVATGSLTWNSATDNVNADLQGVRLWPFLEDLAHKTGWNIYIEPGTDKLISTKFKNLPSGEALKRVLGDLNFAIVPQTNGPTCLYIFRTVMQNATRPVVHRKAPTHVPNELMVKLKPGANIDAIAKKVGAKVIERNDKLGIYLLQFPDAAATDAALGQLQTDPDVQAVDYNYNFDPPPALQPVSGGTAVPGPVSLTLDPPSQNDPCNVVIGLIDTPIQTQLLPSNLTPFIKSPISVVDNNGSGSTPTTQTQSLSSAPITSNQVSPDDSAAAGTPTHATGMAQDILYSMAQASGGHTSAQILPVDVYGSNPTTTSWDVALGIQAAVDKGANVLNLSLGSPGDSAVLDSVVAQAEASGVLIFAAAGNQPVSTPNYPAAIPGVNAVTAVQQGQLAPYADFGSFVDMALPGTSVIYAGNQPWMVEGTSVSTAFATGVAAGTKTSNCDGWPQIQAAMQQKFVVPSQ